MPGCGFFRTAFSISSSSVECISTMSVKSEPHSVTKCKVRFTVHYSTTTNEYQVRHSLPSLIRSLCHVVQAHQWHRFFFNPVHTFQTNLNVRERALRNEHFINVYSRCLSSSLGYVHLSSWNRVCVFPCSGVLDNARLVVLAGVVSLGEDAQSRSEVRSIAPAIFTARSLSCLK